MKKSSNEKFMVNPKVSRLRKWISIPSRKSARIRSRNQEREKSRDVLKVSKPDMLKVDPPSSNVLPFFLFFSFDFAYYTIGYSIKNVINTFFEKIFLGNAHKFFCFANTISLIQIINNNNKK